jgi:hypothetical protein
MTAYDLDFVESKKRESRSMKHQPSSAFILDRQAPQPPFLALIEFEGVFFSVLSVMGGKVATEANLRHLVFWRKEGERRPGAEEYHSAASESFSEEEPRPHAYSSPYV